MYRKEIEVTDTGMVIARVFAEDGRRVGLKFFTPFARTVSSIDRHAKAAHRWADAYIQMCLTVEFP